MTWFCKVSGSLISMTYGPCVLAVIIFWYPCMANPPSYATQIVPRESEGALSASRNAAPQFEKWLLNGVNSLTETPTSHFAKLEGSFASVHDCNLAFAEWLLVGIGNIKGDLENFGKRLKLNGSSLQRFKSRLSLDVAQLAEGSDAHRCINNARSNIDQSTRKRLEDLLHRVTPQYASVVAENIKRSEKELLYLTRNVDRINAFGKLVNDMYVETLSWETFWLNTAALYGDDEAQRQLSKVIAKDADVWNSLIKREIADYLLTRDQNEISKFSPEVRRLFDDAEKWLPLLVKDVNVAPLAVNPLKGDIDRMDVSLSLETSCPGDVRVFVYQVGGVKAPLNVTDTGNNTYRCKWKPEGLIARSVLRQMAQHPTVDLGTWRIEIEVWTTEIGSGYDLCSDLGKAKVTITGHAPFGTKPSEVPVRSGILAKFAREEDIPVDYRHNFAAFIYYPVLGFTRDAVDAVFGLVDKIPIVSAPVSTVYAAVGQPTFKPWWSDQYVPFSRQSAGYLSLKEMGNDEWVFFENSQALKFSNDGSDILMMLGYMTYGLPCDLVDIPFGWLDQIPYVGLPTSYAYQPVSFLTKPWCAERYQRGRHKWERRVSYSQQAKNVIDVSDWWKESGWVFFENFKCTKFKIPDTKIVENEKRRFREALTSYTREVEQVVARNRKMRENCEIEFRVLSE